MIIVVLIAGTLGAILVPLYKGGDTFLSRESFDANIFKDQLKAIDRELDNGQIDKEDAESARVEISRKILESSEKASKEPTFSAQGRELSRTSAIALAVVVPVLALGLYMKIGSPKVPDFPLEARLKKPQVENRIAALISRAEQRLAKHPNDVRGWDIMGPIYLRNEMYGKATTAYENAIRLQEPTAKRLSGLAEAMILGNGGIVSDDVLPILRQAIKMDGNLPKPRFWIGLFYEQTGELGKADSTYAVLLKDTYEGMPWRPTVEARLNGVRKKLGLPSVKIAGIKAVQKPDILLGNALANKGRMASSAAMPGPTAQDVRQAGQMSVGDRKAMINAMVQRLADRLKSEGGDANSWLRLVNAYMVQGNRAKALAAVEAGKKNVSGDKQGVARLTAMGQQIAGVSTSNNTNSARSGGMRSARAPVVAPPTAPMSGPTAADVRRAGQMSAGDRQSMINNMVSRLADRLNEQGGDINSWMRLVRAYNVLGKKSEARKAVQSGKKNLRKDKNAIAQLDALARQLGLGS
ncbi:MAG: c-type cytochrome biogenesis protein CcmI [Hyphomicrobiaceae bacterium]|nr:c-type cytochrome biogenesis protein CcmI [Hyphomicrobiaceae bacterium]